jgi:hypothetical protein
MKRIALLACGLLLLVASTAEARRQRWSNNRTYTRPVPAAPTTYTALRPIYPAPAMDSAQVAESESGAAAGSAASPAANSTSDAPVTTAAHSTSSANVRTVSYSTSSAQGVANLMAAYNRVGHFGGNPGYEGCGCGATPAAAYSICCYGNSGMATVDVGYAQGSNGMWYCCRRYR